MDNFEQNLNSISTTSEVGLSVKVHNNNVDEALRRFKRKVDKAGLLEEVQRRSYYVKPCLAKRLKRKGK